jgi:hypothetical protein
MHDFWEPVAASGWSMDGYYQTVTDSNGESTLKFEGALTGPEKLENKQHFAAWAIGSTDGK